MFEAAVFSICIKGELDKSWSDYFGVQSMSVVSDGVRSPVTTILSEPLDQAGLLGLLNRLNSLGLAVVSVQRLPTN